MPLFRAKGKTWDAHLKIFKSACKSILLVSSPSNSSFLMGGCFSFIDSTLTCVNIYILYDTQVHTELWWSRNEVTLLHNRTT